MTIHGPLKIVPSQELDGLGENQGVPIEFDWPWYGIALWLCAWVLEVVPWVVLAALAALRANRTPKAWTVFVPVAVTYAAVLALDAAWDLESFQVDTVFRHVAWAFTFAVAIVLLYSHRLPRLRPVKTVLWALAAFLLATGAVLVAYTRHDPESYELYAYACTTMTCLVALLLAAVAARAMCRKKPTPMRFRWWMFAMLLLVPPSLSALVLALLAAVTDNPMFLRMPIAVTAVAGPLVLVMLLPFLALLFFSKFYRDRMTRLFRLSEPASR